METRPPSRPTYRARIERIFDHADDVRSLFLSTVGQPLPSFIPGMFISVAMPIADAVRVRPYTIASSPEDGEPFELVFNRVPGGVGAAWMFACEIGDEVDFTGPFGAFTLDQAPDAETVFIAEGTAIAPIRPMIRRMLALNSPARVQLLYVAARVDHLLYREELAALQAAYPRFEIATKLIESGAGGLYPWLIGEVRRRWIEADADRSRHFFICGVGGGVLDLRSILREAGYERRAVHYERW